MTLETIAHNFGDAASKLQGDRPGSLKAILTELQGLSFALVDGAASNAEIAVTGIALEDTIKFVLGLDPDNATPASQVQDFTSAFAVSAEGKIKAAAQATSGFALVVVWYNKA